MNLTRRDFIKASMAVAAAPGLTSAASAKLEQILGGEASAPVIWLQGQSCSGCSVSLLNSIYYTTADDLLLNVIDLEYHPTVMAAAGDLAVSAAEAAQAAGGYVLVIEGAIPTGAEGKYCEIWTGMSIYDALLAFAPGASFILAVGTCAAYGGLIAANTNPTGAGGVGDILGDDPRIINIPGCPAHPDWIVGTIAYLLSAGQAPPLDDHRRPTDYFGKRIHDYCHETRKYCGKKEKALELGDEGCLVDLGCRGRQTYADCFMRKWNSGKANRFGVNWCIGAQSPCHGCTEPTFPGMESFFERYNG